MARDSGSAPRGVIQLIPAATAFDFLEGAFRRTQRARQVFLAFVVASIAVVGALVMIGVTAVVANGRDSSSLDSLQVQQAQVNAKLHVKVSGVDPVVVQAHLAERQAAIHEAAGTEIDSSAILIALQSATPTGVVLTNVVVGSSSLTAPTAGAVTAAPTTTPAAAGSTPAPAAVPAARQLTVTASVKNLSGVLALQDAVSAINLISNVQVTWSGTVPAVVVTLTATVSDRALTPRAKASVPSLGSAAPSGTAPSASSTPSAAGTAPAVAAGS